MDWQDNNSVHCVWVCPLLIPERKHSSSETGHASNFSWKVRGQWHRYVHYSAQLIKDGCGAGVVNVHPSHLFYYCSLLNSHSESLQWLDQLFLRDSTQYIALPFFTQDWNRSSFWNKLLSSVQQMMDKLQNVVILQGLVGHHSAKLPRSVSGI